jgi:SAM-dependent methyltransferase
MINGERVAPGDRRVCPQSCKFAPCFKNIEVCTDCGLGRTSYGRDAPEQRNYLEGGQRPVKLARSNYVFRTFLRSLEPGLLLDIGCSDGVLMDIAVANGWRALGIDPQPNSTDRIIRASFAEYEFRERFDVLTLIHSFEHMDDPRATLTKCRNLIAEDGYLLIVVPNFGGWWARTMGADWQWLNADDHRYHFTKAALRRLIDHTGFRIESITTYSGFAPSLIEMVLSAHRIFEWQGLRWRPLRSLLYKASRQSGLISNWWSDLVAQGAELQVVARPI